MRGWKQGDQIGDYTLTEWLGGGSFGQVWKATRSGGTIQRTYALKILYAHLTDSASFRTEVESWARASDPAHENVLSIHFADEVDGEYILVSDYCPDGTLKDWLESRRGQAFQDREEALDLIEGILRGLDRLHSLKIVHRDLKSANILMRHGKPLLADFGMARTVKETIDISRFGGTDEYKAPDVLRRKNQNEPEDIWSVGIVACLILGGRHPFSGIDEVLDGRPPMLPAGLPPAILAILRKSLAFDRSQRYANAGEMLSALRQARRQSAPVSIARQAVQHPAQINPDKQRRPRSRRAAIVAAFTLIGTIGVGVSVVLQQREQRAQGIAAYESGRYDEAFEKLRAFAKAGDADAMSRVAYIYSNGLGGVPQDEAEAAQLYQKAANAGHTTAMANLGSMYEQGKGGLPHDEAKAVQLYQKAVNAGDAVAMTNLGWMYEQGKGGLPHDEAKAAQLYLKSADTGYAWGMENLGWMYEQGRGGLRQDDAKAAQLYQKAADVGNAAAMTRLGVMYASGRGRLVQDEAKAAQLYQKAADAGDAEAMAYLGWMYEWGRGGLIKDQIKAIQLYKRADNLGNSFAGSQLRRLGQ